MDNEMEYLPINNIKQESEPPSSATNESSPNNNQATPDSVENKVSELQNPMFVGCGIIKKPHGNIVISSTSFRCRLELRLKYLLAYNLTSFSACLMVDFFPSRNLKALRLADVFSLSMNL